MNRIIKLFVGVTLCVGLVNCNSNSHEGHDHHGHAHEVETHNDHGHSHEYPFMNLHSLSSRTELFVEFPVLAAGKEVNLIAHMTSLENYEPYESGTCKVVMFQEGKKIQESFGGNYRKPGLFELGLKPKVSGNYNLVFYFEADGEIDKFIFKNVKVYSSEDEAIHIHPDKIESEDVSFTKDQAWRIDFGIHEVARADIQHIIRTSGEVLPIESDEKSVTADTDGIVVFNTNNLVEGQIMIEGASLFTINNDKLISSNLSEKYAMLKANVDASKKNLDRSKELLRKSIISQKEFEDRERQYAIDLAGYETLNKNYRSGGKTLNAPSSGILKKLYVTNGQFVSEGQSLAVISRNKQLLVEAEVSQKYFKDIPNIQSANIKLPWNDKVESIQNYNGKIVSTGSSAKKHYIPVLFKIDNKGDIMPGTFLEIYLKSSESVNSLVIPRSALLKEYDMYYVYVMTEGEQFEKRNIALGIDDGENVQVLSGLNEHEVIVSQGAYAIKMASMSSSIPSHGHAH